MLWPTDSVLYRAYVIFTIVRKVRVALLTRRQCNALAALPIIDAPSRCISFSSTAARWRSLQSPASISSGFSLKIKSQRGKMVRNRFVRGIRGILRGNSASQRGWKITTLSLTRFFSIVFRRFSDSNSNPSYVVLVRDRFVRRLRVNRCENLFLKRCEKRLEKSCEKKISRNIVVNTLRTLECAVTK